MTKKPKIDNGFVQDEFYEKGHPGFKIKELLIALSLWSILIIPMLVIINSVGPEPLISWIYHWNYAEGRMFMQWLIWVLIGGFGFMTIFSLIFLWRNNHYVTKVFYKRKMYDEQQKNKRIEVLESFYTARFGTKAERELTRSYTVDPEQNIPNDMIEKLFDENGCPIPK